MKHLYILLFLFSQSAVLAQVSNKRFDLELGLGAAYNFDNLKYEPTQSAQTAFYNKNSIGAHFSIGLRYHKGERNFFGLQYARETYIGKQNAFIAFPDGTFFQLKDFKLRHTNHYVSFYYQRSLLKASSPNRLLAAFGLGQVSMAQQEIDVPDAVLVVERTGKNSGLREALLWTGLSYERNIGGHLSIALQSRIYFSASMPRVESWGLIPSLMYSF